MKDLGKEYLNGQYCVYSGEIYRILTSDFWSCYSNVTKEIGIFDILDPHPEQPVKVITNTDVQDAFELSTYVYCHGVEYAVRKLEENSVYYELNSFDSVILQSEISAVDAIVRYREHGKNKEEQEVFYINDERMKTEDLLKMKYFMEENFRGELALNLLYFQWIDSAFKYIKELYGDRVRRKVFSQYKNMCTCEELWIDDHIIYIDDYQEYVSIYAENPEHNVIIRQICEYFNEQQATGDPQDS